MKTESILRILESFYGYKEEYTSEELDRIETLTITRVNPDNTLANVDFSDLLKFKNLRRLTIDGCIVDINVMAYVNTITGLKSLSLLNCDIVDNIYSFFGNSKIKILKVSNTQDKIKNIVFEIVDKDLLNKTNGIIQGMSGSPIIQGEFIIGAVTHVVVDNPHKGYGILITNMLEEGEKKDY